MTPLLSWMQLGLLFPGVLFLLVALEELLLPRRRRPVREDIREAGLRLVLETRYAWWRRNHDRALARYRRALETGTPRELREAEQRLAWLLNLEVK